MKYKNIVGKADFDRFKFKTWNIYAIIMIILNRPKNSKYIYIGIRLVYNNTIYERGFNMIYSNERKLSLSGWLMKNNFTSYETPLKLQKFLLFYEALTKVSGESPDFSHLRGYKKGPVFSNVWGDYTKERASFNAAAQSAYDKNVESINVERAKKCAFIVGTMTEQELSDLTHQMNLWKSKENRIMSGEYQVDLDESDFNYSDEQLISTLNTICSTDMIESSTIIPLDKKYFVFSKSDAELLTEKHFDVLLTLSENEELHNPVFVEFDDEGRLLID